jgi:ribA/ribD-fused uncharacterized protein
MLSQDEKKAIDSLFENQIRFYKSNGEYGFLSNLYKSPILFEERWFPTAEHAYQFAKFVDIKVAEWAMDAPNPHLLAILAHGLFKWDVNPQWQKIKEYRMEQILILKFSDLILKKKLLDTKDAMLIEDSKTDAFWGIGKNGKGRNELGKLLMKIRKHYGGL